MKQPKKMKWKSKIVHFSRRVRAGWRGEQNLQSCNSMVMITGNKPLYKGARLGAPQPRGLQPLLNKT